MDYVLERNSDDDVSLSVVPSAPLLDYEAISRNYQPLPYDAVMRINDDEIRLRDVNYLQYARAVYGIDRDDPVVTANLRGAMEAFQEPPAKRLTLWERLLKDDQ